MTSISTAQPRPPPLTIPPTLPRTQSKSAFQLPKSALQEEKYMVQENDTDQEPDRPSKRRKISTSSIAVSSSTASSLSVSNQQKYQYAPWPAVVRITAETQADRGTETTLPPLPERPWGTTTPKEISLLDTRPPVRVRKNVAVPNTPDCMDIPSEAPQFEQKKRADYFPWTGKHLEDVLSESNVKQGYFDRPPNPPEKELNTAKAPLYNAFKHRSGLDSLSALFSLVLDAKSKCGTFSSTSSFKGPPPRVTLTEAKRKSWISDLANPDVPLRKLSKTIPQGIRGLLLLEQCLQNNIPLSRAIWFTKCVGANEIRTLKRKGVNPAVSHGAEVKWLREWTASVEQFIETILAQCGQNKWKEKIRYSIVLVARMYMENLLDRDHYLDWILKSLSTANTNHWPFWLMMIHLHRLDLVAFRKKGKQLAENLITKYNLAQAAAGDVLQPLAQSFAAAIRPLLAARPNCFLMPEKWNECQKALSSCLENGDDTERQTFKYLQFVNERALGGIRIGGIVTSPAEKVVEILDSFQNSLSAQSLYETLAQACTDREVLMQKCLEWCVSKFRTGLTRIYLCARLFRKLHKQGSDVDKILLEFIFNQASAVNIDELALKHLVSELSRSHTFPISKYMQWLSVRGLPRAGSHYDSTFTIQSNVQSEKLTIQRCKDFRLLLTEICITNAPTHSVNLRNAILNSAGFDENAEAMVFETIRSVIGNMLTNTTAGSIRKITGQLQLAQMSWTIKTRLCYWLRGEVAAFAKASQVETPGKPPLPGAKSLTLRRFQIAREILERSQDIAILADVLRITVCSRQEDILAAAVDTINMHCSPLSAIGALEPLLSLYGQTYVALRPMKPSMPLYVTSLINLCQQYPIKTTPIRALQQDFIRGDRGRAVTACSPFSDGVAESLQQAGASFYDDFEAILQTESNMNDQTMLRLFRVLIERIEKTQHSDDTTHELFSLCQLLARLKLCHKSQGDILVRKWIVRLCSNQTAPISSRLLVSLICTRCIQLETVMETCQPLPASSKSRLHLHSCIRRAIIDEPEANMDEILFYGFKLAVMKLVTTRPAELLDIIGFDESGRSSTTPTKHFLIAAVISNSDLIKTLSKPAWIVVSQTLTEYLSDINPSESLDTQALALATSANALSLPFCSLRMRMLCQNPAIKSDESIQDNIATMLCTSVVDRKSALSASPQTFQTLLRATGPIIGGKVKSSIEQSFFSALPKFLQTKGLLHPPIPTPEDLEQVSTAFNQVNLVSMDGTPSSPSSGITGLVEKLTIYMKTLGPSSTLLSSQSVSSPASATASVTPVFFGNDLHTFLLASLDHLHFLLQMLCVKRSAFSSSLAQLTPIAAKNLQQDQIKLVGLLISIGTHPTWSSVMTALTDPTQRAKIQAGIDFTFDVAATMADDMSDESRVFCGRILKDKIKDERVRWLLGSINSFGSVQSHDTGQGYQVVHETKGVLGEWKPKTWEMLESGGASDSCLGLGLFGARKA